MRRKQEKQIKKLYFKLYKILCAYAFSILRSDGLAEEAVQDTFRLVCGKAEEALGSPNPEGWIMNTLKNVVRRKIADRAAQQKRVVTSAALDETLMTDGRHTDDRLDAEYSDLVSAGDYRLLKMIAIEGYTVREAAQELGISAEACGKRYQRAKARMRKRLEEIEKL